MRFTHLYKQHGTSQQPNRINLKIENWVINGGTSQQPNSINLKIENWVKLDCKLYSGCSGHQHNRWIVNSIQVARVTNLT